MSDATLLVTEWSGQGTDHVCLCHVSFVFVWLSRNCTLMSLWQDMNWARIYLDCIKATSIDVRTSGSQVERSKRNSVQEMNQDIASPHSKQMRRNVDQPRNAKQRGAWVGKCSNLAPHVDPWLVDPWYNLHTNMFRGERACPTSNSLRPRCQ